MGVSSYRTTHLVISSTEDTNLDVDTTRVVDHQPPYRPICRVYGVEDLNTAEHVKERLVIRSYLWTLLQSSERRIRNE